MSKRPCGNDKNDLLSFEQAPTEVVLDQMVSAAATCYPRHPVLAYGGRVGPLLLESVMSYAELDEAADRFAAGLERLGVKAGDRVTIVLPNCPQFVIAAVAIWRLGAVVVGCNPLLVEREVRDLLMDARSKVVIVMSSLGERLQRVRADYPFTCILTNIKEYFSPALRGIYTLLKETRAERRPALADEPETYWFQELLQQEAREANGRSAAPGDVATLIYTGGTTGKPKGVALTHSNLMTNAVGLNRWVNAEVTGEVMVAAMPFFHVYGLLVCLLTAFVRANMILLIPNPRDLRHVLSSIARHGGTIFAGVPTMFVGINSMARRQRFDLGSLQIVASSGGPLPPEVRAQFEQLTGKRMYIAYGMTEAAGPATMDPVGKQRDGSSGLPLPGTEVQIADLKTGTTALGIGETGEVIIRGPQVMPGYWGRTEETAQALRTGPDGRSGWLYTGDVGHIDADGYVHITDRKKDMIIAGGYNIYPADVEAVLYEHPEVVEAAVVGVPDPRRGETVKAFLVMAEGATVTTPELITFCRERLAAYKIPRLIERRDSLPKSPIGKILRRELQREAQLET